MEDWLPPLPDRLPPVLPCVYLTVGTLTWVDRQRAALAFAGEQAVLSGAAALADTGLGGTRRPDSVLVLVPPATRRRSVAWVRLRVTDRLPCPDLQPGPAKAPVARAVADLALETRRLDNVRALVADAVRRNLCSVEDLVVELVEGLRNGSRNLRLAIEEVSGGPWSAPEALAGRLLRAAGVPTFRQNVTLLSPSGGHLYVDFLWRQLRAVLEIDSDEHHGLPADADATDERHIVLESLGLSVAHRRPSFIAWHPKRFTDGISAWLAARAVELDQRPLTRRR
ncbi:MAG TPA: hypothetical protein VIG48_10030 [Jatrophihabitans sp.]